MAQTTLFIILVVVVEAVAVNNPDLMYAKYLFYNQEEYTMIICRYSFKLTLFLVLFAFVGSTPIFQSTAHGIENPIKMFQQSNAEDKGDKAYENNNYSLAFDEYRKAADTGSAYAQFMLANMYLTGDAGNKNLEQYMYWLRQSGENGYASANYLLGMAYLFNDPTETTWYLKKAARKEHGSAMHMLGVMSARGVGVPKNTNEAVRWFRLAKAQGLPISNQLLSVSGVESSFSKSKSRKPKQQMNLVREIQQRLTNLEYNPGPVDGLFGKKTRTAIQEFQLKAGLSPDGLATFELLEALKKSSP